MVKTVLLPICAAVLLAMLNWSCHREPIKPSEEGLNGEITSEPIIVNGVETGYSLSYRSWIIPGEDDSGTKSANVPKGGGQSQDDTISVILHDVFYHVDTCAYVTDWNPSKYANYTLHMDRYAIVGEPNNNITMIDSIDVLRVQYEEFSFCYYINFETAYYSDGTYSQQMPHYTPVVTDLGAEELESLESIVRNDSVFARKILRHSIKVEIGNTSYVLNAIDTLYRYLPQANPNKFVLRSEIVSETIPTELIANYYPNDHLSRVFYPYKCKFKQYYSDGTTDMCEVDFSTEESAIVNVWPVWINNDDAHCDNILSLYNVESYQLVLCYQDANIINEYLTTRYENYALSVTFSGEGVTGSYGGSNLYSRSFVYDDGCTFYQKNFDISCEYSRMEKDCVQSENRIYLKFFFNYKIENLQSECYTGHLLLSHL